MAEILRRTRSGDARRRKRRIAAIALCGVLASIVVIDSGAAVAAPSTIDGQFSAIGPIGQGSTFNLTVVGRGGVPATGVGAVALNVTATNPTANSYLTVWPTGSAQPVASNLNYNVGQTVPNMVIVPVGAGGQISIYNNAGGVDVIVDVLGWFPTANTYTGLTPARLMDTRPASPTIDAQFSGIGQIGPAGTDNLPVVNRGGVPATGVGAVALNVTATNPSSSSYLTVWPTGSAQPVASNLNYDVGQTVPNMVVVPVGADGQISIYNNTGGVDVIVDVLGWFPTGASYTGLTPARLMDTRPASPTIDGQFAGLGQLGAGATTNLPVLNRGGVPATGVGAVALNVTATNPSGNSYLTVWPTGAAQPVASNLNYNVGQTVANMVIVPVGADGQISIYNNTGSVDVVVDVLGWFPIGNSYTGLTPARQMDTRIPAPLPPAAIGPIRNLVLIRPALHQMGGSDRIAVWVCDVPLNTTNFGYSSFGGDNTRLSIDAQAVASWAQQTVGPYYDGESYGRYEPTFIAVGRIALTPSDGPSECLNKATAGHRSPVHQRAGDRHLASQRRLRIARHHLQQRFPEREPVRSAALGDDPRRLDRWRIHLPIGVPIGVHRRSRDRSHTALAALLHRRQRHRVRQPRRRDERSSRRRLVRATGRRLRWHGQLAVSSHEHVGVQSLRRRVDRRQPSGAADVGYTDRHARRTCRWRGTDADCA